MMTTISLSPYIVTEVFFLVIRIFKIYSQHISNVHYSVNYSHYAVHYIPMSYFITGRLCLLTAFTHHTHSPPMATTNLFFVSMSLGFCCCCYLFILKILHITEVVWYLSFSVWLLSLSIIPSRPIDVVTNGRISFLFMAEKCSILYIHPIFIHLSINRHLGCFHFLAIVNKALMNVKVHISFQVGVFAFFR